MKLTLIESRSGHAFSIQNSTQSMADMLQIINTAMADLNGQLTMRADDNSYVNVVHNSLLRNFIIRIEET